MVIIARPIGHGNVVLDVASCGGMMVHLRVHVAEVTKLVSEIELMQT